MTERLRIPVFAERPWTAQAACRNLPKRIFYPSEGRGNNKGTYDLARAVCRRCPVRQECLDWALDLPEKFGMWGGLTEQERKNTRRRRRRAS